MSMMQNAGASRESNEDQSSVFDLLSSQNQGGCKSALIFCRHPKGINNIIKFRVSVIGEDPEEINGVECIKVRMSTGFSTSARLIPRLVRVGEVIHCFSSDGRKNVIGEVSAAQFLPV